MKRTFAMLALTAAAFLSTMAHGQEIALKLPAGVQNIVAHDTSPGQLAAERTVIEHLTVPLMLPAGSAYGQSFVRMRPIAFGTGTNQTPVQVTAIDDTGNIQGRFTTQIEEGHSLHFNSNDIADGNAAKGIEGIGTATGNWRLHVKAPNAVLEVLSYVRTPDGFLTAMHGHRVIRNRHREWVRTFNPASNLERQSRLRVINPSPDYDTAVWIEGYDDDGGQGSLRFTLPAGHARTLTAVDLEEGAEGLEGALGDGTGKWALRILNVGNIDETGNEVHENVIIVQNLLYASSGHISNLSAEGTHSERDYGDYPETAFPHAINLNDGLAFTFGLRFHTGDTDWFKYTFSESGRFEFAVSTFGDDRATATLYDGDLATILEFSSGEVNRREVRGGDYFLQVRPEGELQNNFGFTSGIFVPNTDHHGDTREDATNVDFCEDCEEAGDDTHWGAINAAGDVDWFRIHLVDGLADDTLFFDGRASYFGSEYEVPPSLIGTLYDSAGNELASDAPNDGTFNIRYTVAEERTYYLSVQSDAATEKLAYGVTMGYD